MKHGSYEIVRPKNPAPPDKAKWSTTGEDWNILPIDGFGTPEMIRLALATEQPDALIIFTDPRFFIHQVFEIEDEIHSANCPILYNHLWDNWKLAFPEYNMAIYRSLDLINCINDVSYNALQPRFPDITHFTPHCFPKDMYFPLPKAQALQFRTEFLQKTNHTNKQFIFLFVGRNARRKRPSDILVAFKMFLDEIDKKYNKRDALFIFHSDPIDQEGTNLFHVIEALGLEKNIFFSKDRIDFGNMNALYNIIDCNVNCSSAEGYGCPIMEGLLCEKPAIVTETGGLTRQVRNPYNGREYGVVLEPTVVNAAGSLMVPLIGEDYVSHEQIKNAMLKMYEMPVAEREALGKEAREYVLEEFNYERLIDTWDKTIEETLLNWKKRYSRVKVTTI